MPEDVETSHLSIFLFLLLKFSYSMSCTVVVYTPEGFLLAYFVAKKGEKNGISLYLYASVYVLFYIYFADLPVFPVFYYCIYFATISGYV